MPSVTNNALNREIGELKTRMDSTQERLLRMEAKIDLLVEPVAASKGGLKTLIAVSSTAAGVVAGLVQLIAWLSRHPSPVGPT